MRGAMALDDGLTAAAIKREWHRKDGLECVALRASRRRDIGFVGRYAGRVIKNISNRFQCDAWAIVGDGDPVLRDRDLDDGRNPGILCTIESVIDKLF
jgi:hypothetical protein